MDQPTDRYTRAIETYRKHHGPDAMRGPQPTAESPALEEFGRMTLERTYGDGWSRPGLDMKTREFITMTLLATMSTNDQQFKTHVRGAHDVGVTKDEIGEWLIHLNAYIGTPLTAKALGLIREVWKEMAAGSKSG